MATVKIEYPKNRLEPGIYFGLPEEIYHTDPAIGSTDIRTIRKGPHLYWHRSWLNPNRAPFDSNMTPAKIMGKAIHKDLLEGRQAFGSTYVRRPDDSPGATPAEKGALTKACNAKLRDNQYLLKADDYDFVLGCGELVSNHPELGTVLEGGAREVSIIFDKPLTEEGDTNGHAVTTVRCKSRIDLLKPRGLGDIKSIANEMDRPLKAAARRDIENYRYPLQGAHYLDSRAYVPQLVKAGKVHVWPGFTPDPNHCVEFMERVAAEREYAFQIIFIPKNGDPDACSWTISPRNPIIEFERRAIDDALWTFAKYLSEYGTNQRWPLVDKVEELTLDELSQWYGRE